MTDEQAIEFRKKTLLEYMKMKMNEQDWHGVADSAMDMRELETELKMILHFKQQIQIQQQVQIQQQEQQRKAEKNMIEMLNQK